MGVRNRPPAGCTVSHAPATVVAACVGLKFKDRVACSPALDPDADDPSDKAHSWANCVRPSQREPLAQTKQREENAYSARR